MFNDKIVLLLHLFENKGRNKNGLENRFLATFVIFALLKGKKKGDYDGQFY